MIKEDFEGKAIELIGSQCPIFRTILNNVNINFY